MPMGTAGNGRQTQKFWHLLKGDIWTYETEWDIYARKNKAEKNAKGRENTEISHNWGMRKSEKSSSQTDGKGSRTILKEEEAVGGNLSSLPVTLEVISQYTVGDRHISRPPTAHYLFKGIFFNFILFI